MERKASLAGSSLARIAQRTRRLSAIISLVVALFSLAPNATVRAADAEQGVLEIRIKDHREAIGDFSRLILTVGQLSISPKAGLASWKVAWRVLPPSVQAIDLTKYTGKESISVFRGAVTAGAFDAVQVKLTGVEGVLKKNQRSAKVKNAVMPIQLSFSVKPKGETIIILDLVVLDLSDHPPRGYELGIKGYEVYTNGKLTVKIPPG
jgi:hypothetical protein